MRVMTIENVAKWLCENHCPMTSMELYYEWRDTHHETYPPLLDIAAAYCSMERNQHIDENTVESSFEQAVVDMLVLYGKIKGGENAVTNVFKKAILQISPVNMNSIEEGKVDVDVDNISHHPAVLTNTNSTGDGGDKYSTIVVDSNKKQFHEKNNEDLIGSLQLKLQQTEGNLTRTITTLSERLESLVSIVDPMRKDALIPMICLTATLSSTKTARADARLQLLTLYNRPNREHRAAVAEAWAMTLRHAPPSVIEHDIISELYTLVNAKSTERRMLALDCVVCLVPLLEEGYHALRWAICQGFLRPLIEDEARTVRCHVVKCLVALWPEILNSDMENDEMSRTIENSLLCYVELITLLILHDSSGKVRHYALQSLHERLIHSKCTPRYALFTRIIPLFLSFLERESAVIYCGNTNSEKKRSSSYSTAVVMERDSVEGTVGRNILVLASLIEYTLRCVMDDSANGGVDSFLFEAYLHIVLPSAYSFVLVNQEEDELDASVCAVAAAVASIVPVLDMGRWKHVRRSLELFATKDDIDVRRDAIVPYHAGWKRRQMSFFFAFLTWVAGGTNASANKVSDEFSLIATDAAALLGETLAVEVAMEEEEQGEGEGEGEDFQITAEEKKKRKGKDIVTQSDSSLRFSACALCLIWFATRMDDTLVKSAAVSSVLWSLTESTSEKYRMLAIALVERVGRLARHDKVRELHIWPPLLALMNDGTYEVKEAAVKAALSMVTYISTPMAQEKVMRTALAIVEAEGCPSRLSVGLLRHWSSLVREMPAEPRELYLYPQLVTMIDQLSTVLRRMGGHLTPATVGGGKGDSLSHDVSNKVAEEALEAVLAVLAAIPHCAVVTPQLVKKYLIPGIRVLASVPSLTTSSRSQLLSIEKEYNVLLESSKGLRGTFGLFDRMRAGLKKQH